MDSLESKIDSFIEEVREYRKEHKADMEELKPILEFIRTLSFGRKAILWITTLIVGIGGAFLVIKKLF